MIILIKNSHYATGSIPISTMVIIPSEVMIVTLKGYPILGRASIVTDDTCIVSLEVPTCGDEFYTCMVISECMTCI